MPRRSMRIPWTVWLHLSWDLWRLVLLTAGVLVTVIAFAAAIKPLADGKLGPVETLKFMFLAMPPMLQYALPFAACFGATLAYHRWAADNEIIACHAGGISHRALVVPALVAAVVLSGTVLLLSESVIPRFLRHMAELLSQDVSKYLVHSIERGDAVRLGDRLLYADQVVAQGPDAASGAFERLWLGGLLVVKIDKEGNVEEQISAREASIWLRRVGADEARAAERAGAERQAGGEAGPGGSMTEVVVRPRDAVAEVRGSRVEVGDLIKPTLIPNTFSENPKFLSGRELSALRERPERIDKVDNSRRELALAMAQRVCVEQFRRSVEADKLVELSAAGEGKVTVRAERMRPARRRGPQGQDLGPDPFKQQLLPAPGGSIVVEQQLESGRVRRHEAHRALVRFPEPGHGPAAGAPVTQGPEADARARVAVTLELLNVSARELDENGDLIVTDGDAGEAIGAMTEYKIANLTLLDDPAQRLLRQSSWALMQEASERAAARGPDQQTLAGPLGQLRGRVDSLLREAFSKQQERYAMAAACLVMVLIGGVMAMRLRDSLPLTIYLWAFFPALAAVISINAGQQLTHGYGTPGLLLLWGGVAALAVYMGTEFARLVRH